MLFTSSLLPRVSVTDFRQLQQKGSSMLLSHLPCRCQAMDDDDICANGPIVCVWLVAVSQHTGESAGSSLLRIPSAVNCMQRNDAKLRSLASAAVTSLSSCLTKLTIVSSMTPID